MNPCDKLPWTSPGSEYQALVENPSMRSDRLVAEPKRKRSADVMDAGNAIKPRDNLDTGKDNELLARLPMPPPALAASTLFHGSQMKGSHKNFKVKPHQGVNTTTRERRSPTGSSLTRVNLFKAVDQISPSNERKRMYAATDLAAASDGRIDDEEQARIPPPGQYRRRNSFAIPHHKARGGPTLLSLASETFPGIIVDKQGQARITQASLERYSETFPKNDNISD